MTDGVFPTLYGESLSRREYKIPAGLEGERNLLFVAFLRHQQVEIDRWMAALGDAEGRHPGLRVYEIPLLRRIHRLYRQMIDGGMRAGIPNPATRDRTITVYTDRTQFLRGAGLADEHAIWVVLVDRSGAILWSHTGGVTDGALRSLQARLGD